MEFMYCIPDLEVFIDKTIKKCLLEYDLDANDTEAVLDDMEKAWPKSPPKSPDQNATKDCNGNTKKGRGNLDLSGANRHLEAAPSNTIDTITTTGFLADKSSESAERLNSNEALSTQNGLVKSPSVSGDCSRSDTSSPDAGEGKLQTQKHPKLKSRLQQRYFEGSSSPSSQTGPITQGAAHEGVNQSCDGDTLVPNNLHLLASAANLHTKRSMGVEVRVAETNGYLKERPVKHAVHTTTKSVPRGAPGKLESSRDAPVVAGFMSPLASALSSEIYTSHSCNSLAGPRHPHRVTTKKQESQAARPVPGFGNSQDVIFSGARIVGNEQKSMSLSEEKAKYMEAVPGANLKDLRKHGSPTAQQVQGLQCRAEGVTSRASLQEKTCTLSLNEEKARRLFEHYRNGYHALIPRDVLVVGIQVPPGSEKEELKDTNMRPKFTSGTQKGNSEVKTMKRRLSPNSNSKDFEDKIAAKQLSSRRENADSQVETTKKLSSNFGNRDLDVKKMRKLLPSVSNEGDLEVWKPHDSTQAPWGSSPLKASHQRPVSAPHYHHLAASANSREYTYQHSHGFKPDGIFNQHQYYTSRIASIIVEELEKDNTCQPNILPIEIIPSAHRFSPEMASHVGHKDLIPRAMNSNSLLSYKPQVDLSHVNKNYNLVSNADPMLENISKSSPHILPAHAAKPSHNSVSALLAFHLGHTAGLKNHMVAASSFASDKRGFTDDDNNQPEDLSIKSNSVVTQDNPVGHVTTTSCPNPAATEEHSRGYFSSPTSPVLTSLLGCHTQSSQVLQKQSSSPSPHLNHKKEIDYSSEGETSINYKTLGNWEKKGQVHGLDIPRKGDSKALEKRRAETLKTWSVSGGSHRMKTAKPKTAAVSSVLLRTDDDQMAVYGEKPMDTGNRDAITRGLVDILKPAVEEIDHRVQDVRHSQVELRQQIDSFCEDLKKIAESDPVPVELEPYVKKLNNSRRRVMLVSSILQNVQDRLNRLHQNISKETARRKSMLDPSSPTHQK